MRNNLLQPNPEAPLQVYAVWVDQLGATRSDIDPTLFGDERVTNFWDGDGVVGDALRDEIAFPGPEPWDLYVLYGPDARWDERPPDHVGTGWTVIGESERLEREVDRVLRDV